MFRRTHSHRLSSTLLGTWFALFTVAPTSWRPCPVHGPGEAAGHSPAQATAHTADAGDMAEMQCAHASAAPPAAPPAEPPAEPQGASLGASLGATPREHAPVAPHPCDCPPGCCCIPAVALIHQLLQLDAATLRVADKPTLPPATRDVASRERLLPFANGPPVVTAG